MKRLDSRTRHLVKRIRRMTQEGIKLLPAVQGLAVEKPVRQEAVVEKPVVQKPVVGEPAVQQPAVEEQKPSAVRLTQQVNDFLRSHYDFRFNLLTEETEFRPSGQRDTPFLPVGQRELNTFCLEAHREGINCWDKDLQRYIYSTAVASYHPFRFYMDELPAWDGTDRLEPLARRVSSLPLWLRSFHTWMLGLAAQWMGMDAAQANSVAPILISAEQGLHKSTFCRSLMPPPLSRYYTDNVKLTAQGNPERLLAEMGLLNMDEFDKYGAQKMPLLKNLMQMSRLTLCKAYRKNYRSLPRIASFIGTSNRTDLLCDVSGSRRFICIEVEHDIDCTAIDHAQIYGQLKAELLAGVRHWFSKEEEQALQRHNAAYYRVSPVEDVVRTIYAPASLEEPDCLSLSCATIYKELKKCFPAVLRDCSLAQLAQILTAAGLHRRHTRTGNVYLVKELKEVKEVKEREGSERA